MAHLCCLHLDRGIGRTTANQSKQIHIQQQINHKVPRRHCQSRKLKESALSALPMNRRLDSCTESSEFLQHLDLLPSGKLPFPVLTSVSVRTAARFCAIEDPDARFVMKKWTPSSSNTTREALCCGCAILFLSRFVSVIAAGCGATSISYSVLFYYDT